MSAPAPVCQACGQPISVERTIVARSRGAEPKYCSGDCRTRAARKRYLAAKRAATK